MVKYNPLIVASLHPQAILRGKQYLFVRGTSSSCSIRQPLDTIQKLVKYGGAPGNYKLV